MGWVGPGGMRLDNAEVSLKEVNPAVYRMLLKSMRPYVRWLLVGLGFMVLDAAAGLLGPYLVGHAIDHTIPAGDAHTLMLLGGLYLAAALVDWWASYGEAYVLTWVGQEIVSDLRARLFAHLQGMGLRFYDRMAAGRILTRLTSDVDAISQFVSSALVTIVGDTLLLVAIVVTMLRMNWRLALVSLITLPVLIGVVAFFRGRMRNAFTRSRKKLSDINANLSESISGVRVTQSFVREGRNQERFDQTNAENRQANLHAAGILALFFPAVDAVSALGTALVVWAGGLLLRHGGSGATVGEVAAFVLFLGRFFAPIREMSNVYNMVQAAVVGAERIYEVMAEPVEIEERPDAIPLPQVAGEVRFVQVTFGYEPDRPILHGVDLLAKPGQTIALVGPTGAGKSSVANLLARFYDPQEGQVLVDGHDLRSVTIASWRAQLALVLQDNFLFAGTIAENICFGRPDATAEEMEAAARSVGAHDFISRLPRGYQTRVGERGSGLSVGQRQLIAFARALVMQPRVLILDEATANVDTYTEAMIQRGLQELLRGRTALVIAHRLSTIRGADCICYLDGGRVIEQGTHAELLARRGAYARLYEQQWAAAEGALSAASRQAATADGI